MAHLAGIGDSKLLQRKVPLNTRYKNVGPRVDTGSSVSRQARRIEEMQTNYRYRKNELFKRLKVTTFAQLVLQVANVSMQDEDASISDLASARSEATSIATLNGNHNNNEERDEANEDDDEVSTSSPRSTLQRAMSELGAMSLKGSVIRGVGEVDMTTKERRAKERSSEIEVPHLSRPYQDCPYILLDVRDKDAFNGCHITGALSFPSALLARTMNVFTEEILKYKNAIGRIIILYDEDERLATTAATTLVERGFDNVFIISGGLKVLAQKIPEGLVNGSLPPSCVPAYIAKRLRDSRRSGGQQVTPPDVSACRDKKRFSSDDLDKINHYLDESLIPNDTGSRLSRQSKASYRRTSASKASSVTSSYSESGRRPWK